jgi:hypothetical protein
LAESYVPAVITLSKGLLYTCALCLVWRMNSTMLKWTPLIMLYYDHLLWPSGAFIDSTSLCTDVVAGTLLTMMLAGGEQHPLVWGGVIGWSVVGAGHVIMPFVSNHMLVHIVVPVAGLLCVLSSPPTTLLMMNSLMLWPFMVRSLFFLLLSIIDSYALRPPTQRERDRVCLMRYGGTLLAPMVPCFLVCVGLLATAQATRLYQQAITTEDFCGSNAALYHPSSTTNVTTHKPSGLRSMEEGKPKAVKVPNNSAGPSNDVNSLDVNEAFRLAKLQYMENNKGNY